MDYFLAEALDYGVGERFLARVSQNGDILRIGDGDVLDPSGVVETYFGPLGVSGGRAVLFCNNFDTDSYEETYHIVAYEGASNELVTLWRDINLTVYAFLVSEGLYSGSYDDLSAVGGMVYSRRIGDDVILLNYQMPGGGVALGMDIISGDIHVIKPASVSGYVEYASEDWIVIDGSCYLATGDFSSSVVQGYRGVVIPTQDGGRFLSPRSTEMPGFAIDVFSLSTLTKNLLNVEPVPPLAYNVGYGQGPDYILPVPNSELAAAYFYANYGGYIVDSVETVVVFAIDGSVASHWQVTDSEQYLPLLHPSGATAVRGVSGSKTAGHEFLGEVFEIFDLFTGEVFFKQEIVEEFDPFDEPLFNGVCVGYIICGVPLAGPPPIRPSFWTSFKNTEEII